MIFSQWEYTATSHSEAVVMLDGCRDILVAENSNSESVIRMTNWDYAARTVHLEKGMRILGFRLCPGLVFDCNDLAGLKTSANEIVSFINSAADLNRDVTELIQLMADPRTSIQNVARQAGISTRTLQRHFKRLGLPNPEYWRLLARARMAATALPGRAPLVEIANTFGYSDQAHMTRDFQRWFGATPKQLHQNAELLDEVCQPGLGNWTFEQISIR